MPADTLYVNKAGVADPADPFAREAINKLKQRAGVAAQARTQAPVQGPAAATRTPSILDRVKTTGSGAASALKGMDKTGGIVKAARGIGKVLAPIAGAGQAAYGVSQMTEGSKVDGVENAVLGTLTALPGPTRAAGIVGTAFKTGRDAVMEGLVNRFMKDNTIGPALEEQLAGRTPAEYVAQSPAHAAQQAEQQAEQQATQAQAPQGPPGEVDLGAQLDDPSFVPTPGTGIVRNERTGRAQAISGDAPTSTPETTAAAPQQKRVNIPDLSLAMDVDTLPQFLQQFGDAGQAIVDNKQQVAGEKGIARRTRTDREDRVGEIALKQAEREDAALENLLELSDQSDPDGSRRLELRNLLADLRGSKATDTPEDKYLRELTKSVMNDSIITPEQRAEAMQFIDGELAKFRQRRGGGQSFTEGQIYEDAQGNNSQYKNGQFVPV